MLRPLTLALLLATATVPAIALEPPVAWTAAEKDGIRTLRRNDHAVILGQWTTYTLTFSTDPTEQPEVHGVVGFELRLDGVGRLAFPFDAYEGPDAPASSAETMTLTVERGDGTHARWTYAPAGWIPDRDAFAFGVTALSKIQDSVPRRLLDALAQGADTFEIRIAPPDDAAQPLVLRVPVAGEQARFEALVDHVASMPAATKSEE